MAVEDTQAQPEIIKIEGILFDGNSSKSHPGHLYCSPDGIISWHSEDTNLNETCRADQLHISPRIGSTPRYISFPNEAKFETRDNDKVDYVLKHYVSHSLAKTSKVDSWAHQLEKAKSFILLTVIVTVIGSWGMIQYGIPHFSKQIALALPESIAYKIGSGGLELFDESITGPSELIEERQAELRDQFQKLLPLNQNTEHFELVFRKSEALGANAFAFPSGHVLFTDDMIQLAENDDELRTIMLHEIGHIIHRHSLQRIIQQSGLALLIVLVTGDVGTTSSLILALPSLLLEAHFSQGMETEADTYALEHLPTHGIKPVHFANIMRRLTASSDDETDKNGESGSVGDYFSTHPPTQERISRFLDPEP